MRTDQIDYAGQQILVSALRDVLHYPKDVQVIRLIETHISWVLIAGKYAYKIKKALNLGFLNFTNLQTRQFCCQEELRLNHRLAADIYLDVVPIGGTAKTPQIGQLPAIEYAVRMNCFNPENQLDLLLARGEVSMQLLDNMAVTLADFHRKLPQPKDNSLFGTPETIRAVIRENFEQLKSLLLEKTDEETLAKIINLTEIALVEGEKYFEQRHRQGFIRECHGDLHLGNIVLIENRLVPFDGIEFDPALRWIDVMDEVAFLVMDLMNVRRTDMAFHFLNSYLEITGDYSGLTVLSCYIAYRAEVRAKISLLRARQSTLNDDCFQQNLVACRRYLALAAQRLSQQSPVLIITHGLPGSGKSTFALSVVERYQAIRLRSDVERKRLFGLLPLDKSHSITDRDIYSAETTLQTYNHLHDHAEQVLLAGYSVIVDAAFLKHKERDQFQKLAIGLSVPFVIVTVKAGSSTLKSRILQRKLLANDPSEADLAVLDKLQSSQELLLPHELEKTVEFLNDNGGNGIAEDNPIWSELEKLLNLRR